VTDLRRDAEFDVDGCITEIAARMNGRLPELASDIRLFVEDAILQMGGDALMIELFRASAEGKVDILLRALRHHIAVERIEAPNAALEHARRQRNPRSMEHRGQCGIRGRGGRSGAAVGPTWRHAFGLGAGTGTNQQLHVLGQHVALGVAHRLVHAEMDC
jgi:hypothetical protein